ncbi:hypothetical protein [Rhodoferax sp.]|uniref:hypothetical protein n=1 Tax=Rhodoferax sp. TaxID=50421 RepID=UPI002779D191|nr:hypothetical protein [Rhodoferax sp.]
MATWAYECRPCSGSSDLWLVARERIDELPAGVTVLRVKTGSGWACAALNRSRLVQAEAMLLRDAIASDADDCPDCAAMLAAEAAPAAAAAALAPTPQGPATTQLQAAAISLQGQQMLVVLVGLNVVQSPGEADMLSADLRTRFGGVGVVLMGQHDDGTPQYHGDTALVRLLADLPVEQMPWKSYPIR